MTTLIKTETPSSSQLPIIFNLFFFTQRRHLCARVQALMLTVLLPLPPGPPQHKDKIGKDRIFICLLMYAKNLEEFLAHSRN